MKQRKVDLGVIEFHSNAKLRKEFYRITDDLRESASIVDLWLMEIATTLKKFGYDMEIWANAWKGLEGKK